MAAAISAVATTRARARVHHVVLTGLSSPDRIRILAKGIKRADAAPPGVVAVAALPLV
jgi:hypothetical protein